MASNNDFTNTSDLCNSNDIPVNSRDDTLTVYFSSSCASKHPGRSCRSAGCRHYKSSSRQQSPLPDNSDWTTTSRTDNWQPTPYGRDELYERRIGLLLNYDSLQARTVVGVMGNKAHKDAGVQVSSQTAGEMQAASSRQNRSHHVPKQNVAMNAATNAHELSSSSKPLSFFEVADLSGTHPTGDGAPPVGMTVRRSNSVVRLGLAKEFLREMKECFDSFDRNKDGSISVDELADVMRMLGLEQNQDQLQAMIKAIDRNKNGQIEFGEFVELMKEQWALGEGRGLSSTDDEVERVFRIFDKNCDGKISPEELRAVMGALGEQLTDADLAYMMDVADLDRDGMIDIDEFRHLILLASASAAISPASVAAVARHSTASMQVHNTALQPNHITAGSTFSNNSHALTATSTGPMSPARPHNGPSRNNDSTRA